MILDGQQRRTTGVALRVLEQVGEDPLEATLVHRYVLRGQARGELDRHVGARRLDGVLYERADGHLVAGEVARCRVETGDLQKLADEPPEPAHLVPEEIERLEGLRRQLVAPGLEDRERVGERRER